MSLNDLSLSERSGAVFKEVYICDLPGSNNLLFSGASRGLCSSRIDLVRLSRLKGFGLFFLIVFEFVLGEGESVDANEASDFERVPTGRLGSNLSDAESEGNRYWLADNKLKEKMKQLGHTTLCSLLR